ncbi:hypothetical protein EZV62_019435 [Acer yangbiense]|uniref:cyclin-dependent kinase n=1 Tax=Acer yangbiense TaxID=1000413 RepID=A0A5C7HBF7_9ROSI|nr:hypothetical protein EZV62_019435 [Acer yangbiense]
MEDKKLYYYCRIYSIFLSLLIILQKYLHQILCGLAYCHSHKILHRDLKPRNFLIHRSKDIVKIADFGLARPIDDSLDEYTASLATMRYMAPERLLGHGIYSTPVDVWSVACIFAEMVTRQPLFRARSAINQLFSIFKIMGTPEEETLPGYTSLCRDHLAMSEYPDYYYGFDYFDHESEYTHSYCYGDFDPRPIDELNRVLQVTKMLYLDSRKRITAQEALKHEYLNDLQNAPSSECLPHSPSCHGTPTEETWPGVTSVSDLLPHYKPMEIPYSYKSPEELLGGVNEYSIPIDVWGVGCIFADMINRERLFPFSKRFDQMSLICSLMETPTKETWPGVTLIGDLQRIPKYEPV